MAPDTVATVVVLLEAALRPATRLEEALRPVTRPVVVVVRLVVGIRPAAVVRLEAIRLEEALRLAAVTRPVVAAPAIRLAVATAARPVQDNLRPEVTVVRRPASVQLLPLTARSHLLRRSRTHSCGLGSAAAA